MSLFCINMISVNAQIRNTSYYFPITPTNSDWHIFKSRTEMAQAMQIPADTLKNFNYRSTCQNLLKLPYV